MPSESNTTVSGRLVETTGELGRLDRVAVDNSGTRCRMTIIDRPRFDPQ